MVQKRNPQRSSIANSNTGAFGIIKGAGFIIVEKFNLLIDEKQRSFNGIYVDFRQYYWTYNVSRELCNKRAKYSDKLTTIAYKINLDVTKWTQLHATIKLENELLWQDKKKSFALR